MEDKQLLRFGFDNRGNPFTTIDGKTFGRVLLLFPFLFVFLTGCSNILYLSKLGWHQIHIGFGSIPLEEVMNDETRYPQAREKIRLIQEVKSFGEERLHLKKTKSFSKVFDVKGPVLYAVTASEKDRLKPLSWNFPITGRVTYKSFFTQEDALKEQRFLEEKGYDTFVQEVGAYSTLGWLNDPIFSSMLNWTEAALANLILHEMTHSTIYFKGNTALNEQLASFVGNRGAIDFLTERYGLESKEALEAISTHHDDLLFSTWIDQVTKRLSSFYSQPIPRAEKLKGRETIFQSIKEEFKTVRARFKGDGHRDFDRRPLNNAVVLAYSTYMQGLEKFEALYEHLSRDLRKVIQFFRQIQASGEEPSLAIETRMKQMGLILPLTGNEFLHH